MRSLATRLMSVAALVIGMLLFLSPVRGGAQAPGAPQTGKPEEQLQERNKLAKQIDELRQAGKFDEAVPVAERALVLERQAEGEMNARVAEALTPAGRAARAQGWLGSSDGTVQGGPGRPRAGGWQGPLADS